MHDTPQNEGYDLEKVTKILRLPRKFLTDEIKAGHLKCIRIGEKKDIVITQQQLSDYADSVHDRLRDSGIGPPATPQIAVNITIKDESLYSLYGRLVGKVVEALELGDHSVLKLGQSLVTNLQSKIGTLQVQAETVSGTTPAPDISKLLYSTIIGLQNIKAHLNIPDLKLTEEELEKLRTDSDTTESKE
jgi:hypothetical protein